MNVNVKIDCEVPLDIFNTQPLAERLKVATNNCEKEKFARYEEIMAFLKEHNIEFSEQLSYERISMLFEIYVRKQLLNEAIKYTLTEACIYNVLDSLLRIFNEQKLRDYIMGEPMIEAFSHAISSIPNNGTIDATLQGAQIMLLKKQFTDKRYY